MAEDGGFWLLGLREIDPSVVLGVPMSRPDTGAHQLGRLEAAGLRVRLLPELTDVDTAAEADRIAAATPGSAFAACMRTLAHRDPRTLADQDAGQDADQCADRDARVLVAAV
jgi:hypothetical protein